MSLLAWLTLSLTDGLGPILSRRLVDAFGTVIDEVVVWPEEVAAPVPAPAVISGGGGGSSSRSIVGMVGGVGITNTNS